MDHLINILDYNSDNESDDGSDDGSHDGSDISFECQKCGAHHTSFNDAEYYNCNLCFRFCCKVCRNICDECNINHCDRCSNYFSCCKTLCSNCSWYCFYDDLYKCKCFTPHECFECGIVVDDDNIVLRKKNKYCTDCNIHYCEQCEEYIFDDNDSNICDDCSKYIQNMFNIVLPPELSLEILSFIHETY